MRFSPLSNLLLPVSLGVALSSLAGCGDDDSVRAAPAVATSVKLAFEVGGKPFICGTTYTGLGTTATSYKITDARFFVYGVELLDEDGEAHPLTLDENAFQGDGVALLDFEDGCGDDGSPETHTELTGTAPDLPYRGLRFTLGVPHEKNFVNLTAAAAPLDVSGMFWIWQFGYKFLKVDGMAQAGAATSPFFLHLGASACPGDNVNAPPSAPCAFPNRVAYELWDFDPKTNTVVADLAPVLATTNLEVNMAGTAPGCMSEPTDDECVSILPRLGVNGASVQSFFQVR